MTTKLFKGLETPTVKVERLNPELDYIQTIRVAGNLISGKNNRPPQGYEIDQSFGKSGHINGRSGVQATAFLDKETGNKVIAISGTNEGEDIKDWPTTGKKQWNEIKGPVKDYISNQPENTNINMTGHSLGGGVVQHGMHDIRNPNGNLSNKNIKAVTFDAPSSASSIDNYDKNRVNENDITNYVVKGSPVSVAGGDHVGGNTLAIEQNTKVDTSSIDPISVYKAGSTAVDNHSLDGIESSMQKTINKGKNFDKFDPKPVDYPKSLQNDTSNALGKAGSAVAHVGQMTLNTALRMDAGTIVHLASGDPKQAVRAVAAQTLSLMHGLVMQEVERQQGSPFRTPGIARRAEQILTTFDDTDPRAVVVSKVMDAPRQPKENERVVDVHIPVKLPPVVLDDSGAASGQTPDFNPDANRSNSPESIHRGEDGAVHVKGYTRTALDDIITNNFSYNNKG